MYKLLFSIFIICAVIFSAGSFFNSHALTPNEKFAEVQVAIDITSRISGGESSTGKISVRRNGNTQELIFKLESSHPSLVRFITSEVRLKPEENSAAFQIATAATPIKNSVTIKAFLPPPAERVQGQAATEIVPALLKSVTLSQTTMKGTYGSKINCTVELRSAAPTGGVELNQQIFVSSLMNEQLRISNPKIAAGSKVVTFPIEYQDIHIGSDSVFSNKQPAFNSQTRTVELFIALEPQNSDPWQVIPGIANKITFDVVPLRVTSVSAQPASVRGGTEAAGTFTLNFPPLIFDELELMTANGKARLGLFGTSCQTAVPSQLKMQLTQGVSTYNFKICTAAVTASASETLIIVLRGNDKPSTSNSVQITIQP